MADYKLLDPNRKAVLRLPHLAFKLWMTYFMSESDDQEAYLSNEVIEERSGMSENTIIKWRKWLLKRGWLRPCGGTAAERYSKATRGAHQVLIYRVDDPTKNTATSNFEEANTTPTANSEVEESATANVIPPKVADKVYVSVSSSGCDSGCTTAMPTLSAFGGSEGKAMKALQDKKQKQEQQQQKPRHLRLAHKYDVPFPEGFNDDPSDAGVKFRAEWCEAHRLDKAKGPAPAPVNDEPLEDELGKPAVPVRMSAKPTPPSSAPPPAPVPASSVEQKDWRLGWMKRLAKDVCTLQTAFNPNAKPPSDWDIAWLPDVDALVKLSEGKGSMQGWMLDDVIALSQVRHAAKYTTPAAICADVLALGREVAELRTEGTFAEIRDAYYEVVCTPKQQSDEDEFGDEPTMWVDPEVKAERERKELAKLIMRWNTWLDANTPQQKTA